MFWFSESIVRPRVSIVGNTPTPLCSCCHNCTLSLPQWPSAATHLRHWRVDSSCTPLPLCLCFIWRSYAIGNLGLTPRGIEESQTRSAVGRRLFFLCRYLFFFSSLVGCNLFRSVELFQSSFYYCGFCRLSWSSCSSYSSCSPCSSCSSRSSCSSCSSRTSCSSCSSRTSCSSCSSCSSQPSCSSRSSCSSWSSVVVEKFLVLFGLTSFARLFGWRFSVLLCGATL